LPEPIETEQIPVVEDVTQQIPLDALQAMGVESARLVAEAAAAAAEDQPIVDEDAAVEVTGDQPVIVVQQQVPGSAAALVAADEAEPIVVVQQAPAPQNQLLRRANTGVRNIVIQPPLIQEVPPGAPARLFPSPIPGAPPTIAVANPAPSIINVDTSPGAMAAEGLAPANASSVRRATVGNFTVNRAPEGAAPAPQFTNPIVVNKLG